jgi:hypothetical protein
MHFHIAVGSQVERQWREGRTYLHFHQSETLDLRKMVGIYCLAKQDKLDIPIWLIASYLVKAIPNVVGFGVWSSLRCEIYWRFFKRNLWFK